MRWTFRIHETIPLRADSFDELMAKHRDIVGFPVFHRESDESIVWPQFNNGLIVVLPEPEE